MFLILLFPPYYPNHFAALPPNHPLSLIKKCWLILLYDNCQHLIQSFAFHKCYWWTVLSCCLSPYINSPHPFLIHLYMSFFDLWCSYLVPDYILNHCYWCFFWFSSTNHLRCYLYYFFKGWWLMMVIIFLHNQILPSLYCLSNQSNEDHLLEFSWIE